MPHNSADRTLRGLNFRFHPHTQECGPVPVLERCLDAHATIDLEVSAPESEFLTSPVSWSTMPIYSLPPTPYVCIVEDVPVHL
jgi:hypothetical protein